MKARMLRMQYGDFPVLSWQEVQKHVSVEDCWMVVNNVAVDVTWFLQLHPAGQECVLRYAGTDATEHFIFHSKQAQKLWRKSPVMGFVLEHAPKKKGKGRKGESKGMSLAASCPLSGDGGRVNSSDAKPKGGDSMG